MKSKKINALPMLSIVGVIAIVMFFTYSTYKTTQIDESGFGNPEIAITNLYKSIEIAKQKGEYKCCINPACTMCYLGHWEFEKGTCYCDDKIKQGDFDSVCPECRAGIEKGLCSSSKEEECEVDSNILEVLKK